MFHILVEYQSVSIFQNISMMVCSNVEMIAVKSGGSEVGCIHPSLPQVAKMPPQAIKCSRFSLSIKMWSNHEPHMLYETMSLCTCDCLPCSKWTWSVEEGGTALGQSPSPNVSLSTSSAKGDLWWSDLGTEVRHASVDQLPGQPCP